MGEKEMPFYESKEFVLGTQRVTLRVASEEGDIYDNFQPKDTFAFKITNDFHREEEKKGVILGHWVLPLASVPIDFIVGQAYDIEIDNNEDQIEIVDWMLRRKTKDDLLSYSPITDLSDVHVIVYLPNLNIDEQLFQLPNEDPAQWVERCGNSVLGHIDSYNRLKEFSKE